MLNHSRELLDGHDRGNCLDEVSQMELFEDLFDDEGVGQELAQRLNRAVVGVWLEHLQDPLVDLSLDKPQHNHLHELHLLLCQVHRVVLCQMPRSLEVGIHLPVPSRGLDSIQEHPQPDRVAISGVVVSQRPL
eukprot:2005293-Rhodomonas_salina.1